MELESWGQPARGLRLERPLTGYIPLAERVATFPEFDFALVWDERAGWRAMLEPAANDDLVMPSCLDTSVCPPAEVAEYAVVRLG